jgi:hypothetical protein
MIGNDTYIGMIDNGSVKNTGLYVQVGVNGDPVKIGNYCDPATKLKDAAAKAGVEGIPKFKTPWIIQKGMLSVPEYRMNKIFGGSQ